MTKVTAPLLSWDASGTVAKTQVYSSWKGRPYVRRWVKPANPDTAAQQLTRNTFAWLTMIWKYWPGAAVNGWSLYADNSRFTTINGFLKQNIPLLRTETDLANLIGSPAAGSGLAAKTMVNTPTTDQITCDLTPPAMPTGWSIVNAWCLILRDVNPQSSTNTNVWSDSDATDPYTIVITGLASGANYMVCGWFEYLKANGESAYGQSLGEQVSTS